MRLKLGRPDIERYADYFRVPPATLDSPVTVTFLGVATVLVSDGSTGVLTDGFFTRPSLRRVALGRVAPDRAAITTCLDWAGVERLDAVVPLHTHYDHALDSAAVAARTGALLVGGASAAMVGRGCGLPEERIRVVATGDTMSCGTFDLTFVESQHCPPDRFPGEIEAPVVPPARVAAYRCGEAWSLLVGHRPTGRRLLVQSSAGFLPGALRGQCAEAAYLGVGQLGTQHDHYLTAYWCETVRMVGARRAVLIHWDDFFRGLDQPLRALPYAGDDLDATMRMLCSLAEEDGVALHLPSVWRREDPWR